MTAIILAVAIPTLGAGHGRDIGAGCLASQLATRRDGTRPSKELAIAKALLAGQHTLVAVWIGAVAAQTLAAAVVAALGGRVDVRHGRRFRRSGAQALGLSGFSVDVMLDETVDWGESLA